MKKQPSLSERFNISDSDINRFWSKVNKDGPTPVHVPHLGSCWIFSGGKTRDGYGAFYLNGRNHPAHRVAFVMQKGRIDEGVIVMHDCDNPECVRHLSAGTQADNLADMRAKGRQRYCGPKKPMTGDLHWSKNPKNKDALRSLNEKVRQARINHPELFIRGEKCHFAKLSEADVLSIRSRALAGEKRALMAVEYGVSVTVIGNVITRRSWKHID